MEVVLHLEAADGRACWWAESHDLPGWTAAAPSLPVLRALVDELGVPYTERLDAPVVGACRQVTVQVL